MVFHVDVVRIVHAIKPHAIVEGNTGHGRVGSSKGVSAVGGVAARNFPCAEADHCQVWNVQVRGIRTVYGDVPVASSRSQTAGRTKSAYEYAAIRLTLVLERQRSVNVWPAVCSLIPAP